MTPKNEFAHKIGEHVTEMGSETEHAADGRFQELEYECLEKEYLTHVRTSVAKARIVDSERQFANLCEIEKDGVLMTMTLIEIGKPTSFPTETDVLIAFDPAHQTFWASDGNRAREILSDYITKGEDVFPPRCNLLGDVPAKVWEAFKSNSRPIHSDELKTGLLRSGEKESSFREPPTACDFSAEEISRYTRLVSGKDPTEGLYVRIKQLQEQMKSEWFAKTHEEKHRTYSDGGMFDYSEAPSPHKAGSFDFPVREWIQRFDPEFFNRNSESLEDTESEILRTFWWLRGSETRES